MSEYRRFEHEVRIPYDYTDAQGRVFYANYWLIADAARYAFWEHGLALGERRVVEIEHAFFIAHLECDFHGASEFYDRLAVSVEPSDLGRTSLRLGYRMEKAEDRAPVFSATSVIVWANLETGRPVPWPDYVREALVRHRGPEVLRG